jgi:ribonuclease HI
MDDGLEQNVYDRKLTLCSSTRNLSPDALVVKCPHCNEFYLYCCHCSQLGRTSNGQPCHHFRVIYIDGACKNNGRPEATAGAGVVFGADDLVLGKLSIPINDANDNFPVRSNQRAELLAAKLGLELLQLRKEITTQTNTCIIATDSEYVVKGITEWLLKWRVSFP